MHFNNEEIIVFFRYFIKGADPLIYFYTGSECAAVFRWWVLCSTELLPKDNSEAEKTREEID